MLALTVFGKQGVSAFWARSPNTELGDVTLHWITEGNEQLVVRQSEQRCILVSSGTGPESRMYARFRPCDAKASKKSNQPSTPRSHALLVLTARERAAHRRGRGRAAAAAGRDGAALVRPRAGTPHSNLHIPTEQR